MHYEWENYTDPWTHWELGTLLYPRLRRRARRACHNFQSLYHPGPLPGRPSPLRALQRSIARIVACPTLNWRQAPAKRGASSAPVRGERGEGLCGACRLVRKEIARGRPFVSWKRPSKLRWLPLRRLRRLRGDEGGSSLRRQRRPRRKPRKLPHPRNDASGGRRCTCCRICRFTVGRSSGLSGGLGGGIG